MPPHFRRASCCIDAVFPPRFIDVNLNPPEACPIFSHPNRVFVLVSFVDYGKLAFCKPHFSLSKWQSEVFCHMREILATFHWCYFAYCNQLIQNANYHIEYQN